VFKNFALFLSYSALKYNFNAQKDNTMDVNINKLRRSAQQLLQLTASEPEEDAFVLNLHKFLKKKVSTFLTDCFL